MLRIPHSFIPKLSKTTLILNKRCIPSNARRKVQTKTTTDADEEEEYLQLDPLEKQLKDQLEAEKKEVQLPKNVLYSQSVSEQLVCIWSPRNQRIFGHDENNTNFAPYKKFVSVWESAIHIRRSLLAAEEISDTADPATFPTLFEFYTQHKRFLARRIMRNQLPPQYRAFVLNWDIQAGIFRRDDRHLEFLYQKYQDCFPRGYIEKLVKTFSTSQSSSAVGNAITAQIPKWIERMGSFGKLEWDKSRGIALMAYAARTDDIKLFTELLNDFMANETNPESAWKAIKDVLASETNEETLKDLYEAALSAKMVTPELNWAVILGLNRAKNTKAILDLMNKTIRSDPKQLSPQACDVAVQALLAENDIENAYALFLLRSTREQENILGYKKTRTQLLLAMAKNGYQKRMIELYEKSWESPIPLDGYAIQMMLTYYTQLEQDNPEMVEYFWKEFEERDLNPTPITYSLMTKYYLKRGETENVKLVAEMLRANSEEGSRTRMIFGTARITHALETGKLNEALEIFNRMANPDAAVYAKMIPALIKAGRLQEAETQIRRIKEKIEEESKAQSAILNEAELMNMTAKFNATRNRTVAELLANLNVDPNEE